MQIEEQLGYPVAAAPDRDAGSADRPATEMLHPEAHGLELRPDSAILELLLQGQLAALSVVRGAFGPIAQAARMMADCLSSGGRLAYLGAGSSALMASADAMELAGTYGVPPDQVLILMAGGPAQDATQNAAQNAAMPGGTEDDAAQGAAAVAALGRKDCLIAVAASGRTPFVLGGATAARAQKVPVIALANNPGTPLLALADAAVCLPTPPEVISGSTRLGAATAQKAALNLMSTLMGIRLGQVHDGMMVGLRADNAKLRQRAVGIVAAIAGVPMARAEAALAQAGGAVKPAVLIAGGQTPAGAAALLKDSDENLRAALARSQRPGPATGQAFNHGST